jgi:hypothetical protein
LVRAGDQSFLFSSRKAGDAQRGILSLEAGFTTLLPESVNEHSEHDRKDNDQHQYN